MPINPSPFPSPAPRWSRPLRTSGACLLAILVMACGGGGSSTPPPVPPPAAAALTSITLAPSGPTLNVGASVDVQATGHFSDGTTVTPYDSQVTWTSSAPGTASVSASGLVNGVAAGTANITAAKGSIQGSAPVTVIASTVVLRSITLNPAAGVTLNVGQTADFTATANWSNGTSTTPYDSSVIWTTNLPSVATVNAAGVVTAVAAGAATLTASANGLNTTAAITVNTGPTLSSISLSPASATLNVGQTVDITSTANWSNGTSTVPYDSYLTWVSSAPSVATVNAGGVVTAVAVGNATITASLGAVSRTAAITVSATAPTLTALSLDLTSATGTRGQTMDLTATGRFSDGSTVTPYDAQVTWTSNAPTVATVNAAGLVTAIWRGTAIITASKGNLSATCTVTVNAPFDAALVGRWLWVGFPNPIDFSNATTQYTFYADGTFTYFLTRDFGTTCISYGKVEAVHVGTYSNTSNQIIFNCTSHVTNYYGCDKRTLVYQAVMTPGIHVHTEVSFPFTNVLRSRNDGFDFMNTGLLDHTKQ